MWRLSKNKQMRFVEAKKESGGSNKKQWLS